MKIVIGFVLSFLIGAGCRYFGFCCKYSERMGVERPRLVMEVNCYATIPKIV